MHKVLEFRESTLDLTFNEQEAQLVSIIPRRQ